MPLIADRPYARPAGSGLPATGSAVAGTGLGLPEPGPRESWWNFGRRVLRPVAPNWFAAVMGTGILATAAIGLPGPLGTDSWVHAFATGAWLLAATLLIGVSSITAAQWIRRPELARSHHRHPVIAHFYGAPPMALMSVGAGTLLLGPDLIGPALALRIDWALWTAGTLTGLLTSVAVPFLLFSGGLGEQARRPEAAFGGWLMPVVPPMVSASTGALLLPHCPAGQPRLTLLLTCYALFGLSLFAAIMIIPLIWARLIRHGLPEPRLVPTLWIVLGPLGQSVTAAIGLGQRAHLAIAPPYASGLHILGLVYGLPVLGFALLWACLAAALTVRTARTGTGLPFAATWWAFTFPVGTCVSAASGLAGDLGADVLTVLAALLFTGLVTAWVLVAARTVGSVRAAWADRPRTPAWAYSI
jgi:C4-dicarboxylate transporter/malic acid transport protein